jgi:hypothetical protein
MSVLLLIRGNLRIVLVRFETHFLKPAKAGTMNRRAVGAPQRKSTGESKENQSAKTKAGTMNGQRRRRVAKLAPGVSPGKQNKK